MSKYRSQREQGDGQVIDRDKVQRFLRRCGYPDARIESMAPLGQDEQVGTKSYGYGRPLAISFATGGSVVRLVLRTMSADPFGHQRRSDRIRVLVDSFDVFKDFPQHVRPLQVGTLEQDGELRKMAFGEPFLVTEFAEGVLYAVDLGQLGKMDRARPIDLQRAETLARFLAKLHSEPAERGTYRRDLRDTIGGGEGIFGLCDSYPGEHKVAGLKRLEEIELAAVRRRWRLRDKEARARRTHGDFHPFNILFREGTDFSLLDASRGGAGEPADDVTCLCINYLFFGLIQRGRFEGPQRELWDRFWQTYLDRTGDTELLEAAALYFAWRGLVLASPVWYPGIDDGVRDRLLRFVERVLGADSFDPHQVHRFLS